MGPIAGPRPEEDSAGPRSESLDALRGLAISAVIARHYFEFKYGMLGVDLFFVVSGFLIGGILLDSREQRGYFSSFYGRRAFRILPLYWLLLLIATPDHWGYYLFFLQAVPWLQFGYPMTEPTFVSWTLAIEEQFYLILPLLIWSLPREWLVRVLWCGVLIAPACRWLFHAHLPDLSWEFLLPCRLDELFGGVLLACFVRGYCRSPLVWTALACVPMLCDLTYAAAFWTVLLPRDIGVRLRRHRVGRDQRTEDGVAQAVHLARAPLLCALSLPPDRAEHLPVPRFWCMVGSHRASDRLRPCRDQLARDRIPAHRLRETPVCAGSAGRAAGLLSVRHKKARERRSVAGLAGWPRRRAWRRRRHKR
ncbi:acyltransferase [Bradyrhizobium brasilense]|uniref:acyltransferase family protein n=1 Tax=Bradyrhizobium brasilense TaxID=1419277 RepID=UPI0028774C18|nr:acyltransferase [Bradyrhizobium brasilense]MCP3420096.1 acyltransferase [Bradyrhizobium brasilense]